MRRIAQLLGFAAAFVLASGLALADGPKDGGQLVCGVPMFRTIVPDTAKAGDLVTVNGEGLQAACILQVFLSKGSTDVEVKIVSQNTSEISFKVPVNMKEGRYRLVVLAKEFNDGKTITKYLEEPIFLVVEETAATAK